MKEIRTPRVAYFCMEFGLHEDLPIYAGGLGVLAGDYLKAARELELPIVGIGILWKQDYTDQYIEEGRPIDRYIDYNFEMVEPTGREVKVEIGVKRSPVKFTRLTAMATCPSSCWTPISPAANTAG